MSVIRRKKATDDFVCKNCGEDDPGQRRYTTFLCRTCYNVLQKQYYSKEERATSFSNTLSYQWMRRPIRVDA